MKHDQASHTARFVSNGIYWVSQHKRLHSEVPEDLARYTAEMTGCFPQQGGSWARRLVRRWILFKAGLMQACAVPGIYLHQVLRKRHIERLARKSLDQGVTQLVVIGAGLDTLGLRLSVDYPDHRFIEIDHPATQRLKRSIVDSCRLPMGSVEFVSADLAEESLASAMQRCSSHEPDQPTVFIAEGITMYLSESSIRILLNSIADQAAGSAFIFTYMEEKRPGCYDFSTSRLVTSWWLALRHERFAWGMCPSDLSSFLSDSGLRLQDQKTPEDLRRELLTESNRAAKLASGENTAIAFTGVSGHARSQ